MRNVECGAFGQRDAEPHHHAAAFPRPRAVERLRQLGAPCVELLLRARCDGSVAGLHRDRDHGLFRNADLVGAGEPVGDAGQRQVGSRRDTLVDADIGEQRIGMFIDMVHQPKERQRLGNRIAKGAHSDARRRVPFDLHAETGIAAVRPIAVPTLFGGHRQGNRRRSAGRRYHRFGDQPRRDMRGLRPSRSEGEQNQGEQRQQRAHRRRCPSVCHKAVFRAIHACPVSACRSRLAI